MTHMQCVLLAICEHAFKTHDGALPANTVPVHISAQDPQAERVLFSMKPWHHKRADLALTTT